MLDADALECPPLTPVTQCTKHRNPNDLEVYDDGEDQNGGQEVHEVGEVLTVEGLTQTPHLVLSGGQQVEEGNHCTFKLRACKQHMATELHFDQAMNTSSGL